GVFALGITHCGENCVAVARESFGEKAAKAGARASDEDYLIGIHGVASMNAYSAPGRGGSKAERECRWKSSLRGPRGSAPFAKYAHGKLRAERGIGHKKGAGLTRSQES